MTTDWLQINVTLDDGDEEWSVPSLWDGWSTWNGWLMPRFDREAVQTIMDRVNSWGDPWNALKWEGNTVVEYAPACPDDCRSWTSIQIDGKEYWDVGAGSWVWQKTR